jgi:hypothetical protein
MYCLLHAFMRTSYYGSSDHSSTAYCILLQVLLLCGDYLYHPGINYESFFDSDGLTQCSVLLQCTSADCNVREQTIPTRSDSEVNDPAVHVKHLC